ncbi:MAG: DUF3135 domain-containing protein [Pseudomonadota bacterium]
MRIDLIDFDAWVELARNDPEAFEARRRNLLEEFISQAAPAQQRRLRCLQWRVDIERKRASNPMAACVRISQMMWDSFVGENGLREAINELYAREPRREKQACLISFPAKPRARH